MRKHSHSRKKSWPRPQHNSSNSRTICCSREGEAILMIKSNCLDQIRSLQVKTILLENRMSPLAAMTSQSLGLKQACVTAQFLPTPQTSRTLGIWRNAGTRLTSFWMRSRPRCSIIRCALNTLRNSQLHTISSHISSYAANACQLKIYKKTTTKSTQV